jgi:hypothetical protein
MEFGKRCQSCGAFHSPLVSCELAGRRSALPQLEETQRLVDELEDLAISRYRNRGRSLPRGVG